MQILEQIQGQVSYTPITRSFSLTFQAVASQRALSLVRAQIQSKEKERKILSLTMREINAIPKDDSEVKLYKGVGKMSVFNYYL
jgi:hypothetical protein